METENNELVASSAEEAGVTLEEIKAAEELEKKKENLEHAKRVKKAAKKLEKDPELRYKNPLMNCEMNLMEISNRTVEEVEKMRLLIVGKSTGDFNADKKEFSEFLLSKLVKFN